MSGLKTINFEAMLVRWQETSNLGCQLVIQLRDAGDLEPFKAMSIKKGDHCGQLLQFVCVELNPDTGTPVPPPEKKAKVPDAHPRLSPAEKAAQAELPVTTVVGAPTEPSSNLSAEGKAAAEHPPFEPNTPPMTPAEQKAYADDKEPTRKGSHFPDGLAGLAVKWCMDPHFQNWAHEEFLIAWNGAPDEDSDEDKAKFVICKECDITSRKELNTLKAAGSLFTELFLSPYRLIRERDNVDEGNF